MRKYIIHGGKKLEGEVKISGSKNVISKAIVAACLTSDTVEIQNIPLISDLYISLDLITQLGGEVELQGHTVKIKVDKIKNTCIPLDAGAKTRVSSLFLAPFLLREKNAMVPNPGGCRLGVRPIDRHIKGLEQMGVRITYNRKDGYFHAVTDGLHGTTYTFEKNTHTGTETLILAAVLAEGQTVLHNAAEEPEVDDLISMLKSMGAQIKRNGRRTIVIDGVPSLHGTKYSIMPDRNEAVTFAIASALTGGKIAIKNIDTNAIIAFLDKFKEAGGDWEEKNSAVTFFIKNKIKAVHVTTLFHPGFMTDWQGPWAVLMTQANGISTIHETIYENRFSYFGELQKMGAELSLYNPRIENPEKVYNFNFKNRDLNYKHAMRIYGKTLLHNAVLTISDLRAGATLVLAALIAKGESVVFGVEHIERGYEQFDKRLRSLGADIKVVDEST